MVSSAKKKAERAALLQREAARRKANARRAEINSLKKDLRSGQLDLATALRDPRAAKTSVLRLLPVLPRCELRTALDVLLICRINGADTCGEICEADRQRLCDALASLKQGKAVIPATKGSALKLSSSEERPQSCDPDDLDQEVAATLDVVPIVEQKPSEFLRALQGLEGDVLTVRMVERMVAALRFYVDEDDGGATARRVLDHWLRLRNYRDRVVCGELPPPTLGAPEAE